MPLHSIEINTPYFNNKKAFIQVIVGFPLFIFHVYCQISKTIKDDGLMSFNNGEYHERSLPR
ncbi:hypothetical protein B8W99_13100 [Peribacillus simplex]|nr:hypothetical protein B8W99_13100 [Peribacillus simplex]